MRLELQILAAVALDLLLGDPRKLPHPVRLIALLALALERLFRGLVTAQRTAGILTVCSVLFVTGSAVTVLMTFAASIHPLLSDGVSILLLYTTLAARDLTRHSAAVYAALSQNQLTVSRIKVGMFVGRDTKNLDEAEIVRAAVESVAENTVDGVTAPLFYAAILGPLGAVLYKAVNTMDSTFGYKNQRYFKFGWAAARLDDLANLVPARITAWMTPLASLLLNYRAKAAWRILRRDGHKHSSPNAGLTEAAFAGALGIQLGGVNYYQGIPSKKPQLGDPVLPLERRHIRQANQLMLATYGLLLFVFLSVRLLISRC